MDGLRMKDGQTDARIDGGWTHRDAGWNDGWLMDELTDRRMDVLMDRQDGWRMDGRVDAWMNRHRRRDGWTDHPPHTHTHTPSDFDCDRPFRAPPRVAHLKPSEERAVTLAGPLHPCTSSVVKGKPRPALRHPASLPRCHSARPRARRTHTPAERYNGVWLCRAAAAAAAADVVAERSRFPGGARSGFILGMGREVGGGEWESGWRGCVMRQIST